MGALGVSTHALARELRKERSSFPIVVGATARCDAQMIRNVTESLRSGLTRAEVLAKYNVQESAIDVAHLLSPDLKKETARRRTEKTLAANRAAVTTWLSKREAASRTELRAALPGPISFLWRHDRAWIRGQFNSIPIRPRGGAQPPKAGRGRIDDADYDSEVAAAVRGALPAVQNLEPPRRITATLALQVSGVSLSAFERIAQGRMPKTKALLDGTVESLDAFVVRKLEYAFRRLSQERDTVTMIALRLRSGLTEKRLIQFSSLVRQEAEKWGMPISRRSARLLEMTAT